KKGSNYLRLKDEDKYTLFFQYIWSNEFIKEISKIEDVNIINKLKRDLVGLLYTIEANKSYEISELLKSFVSFPKFFFEYYAYLQYLGIIECMLCPSYEIKITSLGKTLINYLKFMEEKNDESSVIKLELYKKN